MARKATSTLQVEFTTVATPVATPTAAATTVPATATAPTIRTGLATLTSSGLLTARLPLNRPDQPPPPPWLQWRLLPATLAAAVSLAAVAGLNIYTYIYIYVYIFICFGLFCTGM